MKLLLPLLAGLSLSSTVQAAPHQHSVHRRRVHTPGVAALTRRVAVLLKHNDMRAVSRLVDAKLGLRISFQPHVEEGDVHLTRAQVAALQTDQTVREWGMPEGDYNAHNNPARTNWANYRKEFVFPRDFTRGATLAINQPTQAASSLANNIRAIYPKDMCAELYLPPTKPELIDWATLWMVWHKSKGAWRLIGIANEQWEP